MRDPDEHLADFRGVALPELLLLRPVRCLRDRHERRQGDQPGAEQLHQRFRDIAGGVSPGAVQGGAGEEGQPDREE